MSLDISLFEKEIIVCECGKNHVMKREKIFQTNTTGNLHKMAKELGVYEYLWTPKKLKITKANQLIEPLTKALANLKANEEHYKKFDAPNGFGVYSDFVFFIEDLLNACTKFPDTLVEAVN